MRADLKQYLQYVVNTGGNATIERFDDDWEPIGPMVRRELMPTFVEEGENGFLKLTADGEKQLASDATT